MGGLNTRGVDRQRHLAKAGWLLFGSLLTLHFLADAGSEHSGWLRRRTGTGDPTSCSEGIPASVGTDVGRSEAVVPVVSRVAIEQLQAGDFVWARDPRTGIAGPKRVAKTFRRKSDHVRVVTVGHSGGAQTLQTTDNHPFWVVDHGWRAAADLKVGDPLLQDDLVSARVLATSRRACSGITVFNLETEDFHTYFVSAGGSRAPPVWVHNCKDLPDIIYRSGNINANNLRRDPSGISFWGPLANPIDAGKPGPWRDMKKPIFGPGERYTAVDVNKLPPNSVKPFGDHPNHFGMDPTTPWEDIEKAIIPRPKDGNYGPGSSGKFPKK